MNNGAAGHHPTHDVAALEAGEALARLGSSPSGLSPDEAARRLSEFGPNQVPSARGPSVVRELVRSFAHFFALVLMVAAGLAFVAESREPGQGMGVLGVAIVAVVVLNGAFSFWQEFEAERAVRELQKLLPQRSKVRRGGAVVEVERAQLVPGDVVLLEGGDDVPADCRLVEATGVRVTNATVTGESAPVERDASPSRSRDPMQATNLLLAGTALLTGRAEAAVVATGPSTELGRIAHLTRISDETQSPLQAKIVRMSRVIAAVAVGLGAAFFFVGRALGMPLWSSLIFAIGILVANVPEGLLPTVTLALAMASRRMAARNVLVRNLPAVEALGSATVICTDKTGTLTENRMVVKHVWAGGPSGGPDARSAPSFAARHRRLVDAALRCQGLQEISREGRRATVGDPLEVALVGMAKGEMAKAMRPLAAEAERLGEIPFDASRKYMSVAWREAGGPVAYAKGALEALAARAGRVDLGGETVPLDEATRQKLVEAEASMARSGLRVLALAYRELSPSFEPADLERDLVIAGLVGLYDPPRPEVPGAIATCRRAGVRVVMTTGDHPMTAEAIAREVGLVTGPSPLVLTGPHVGRLSEVELQLALEAPEVVCARLDPGQKRRVVTALQRKGHVVAVTGDGVNDAPALRAADIGVAMGRSGTDVAREAADLVLLDDNFASIVAGIEEGRAVAANIRKFLTYILTSNVPELVPYLAFVLLGLPLPLTVAQILAVDLGTDIVPALALGAEPPDPAVMDEPPRPRGEALLDAGLFARAYLWLGPLEALASMAAYFFVLHQGGYTRGAPLSPLDPLYREATAACLAGIVVAQIANVLCCRSETRSIAHAGLGGNRLLPLGIAVEIAAIVALVATGPGQLLFGTAPVRPGAWAVAASLALVMIALEETRKAIVRSRQRARLSARLSARVGRDERQAERRVAALPLGGASEAGRS